MARKVRVMMMATRSAAFAVLQRMLESSGYHMDMASHQNDVIEAIDASGVDIVVISAGWQAQLGEAALLDLQKRAGRRVRFIYFMGSAGSPPLVEPRKGYDRTLPARYTLRMLRAALSMRRRYQPNIQNRGLAA